MGWWAVDVFGGDEPLDVLDATSRILDVRGEDKYLPTPDEWDDKLAGEVRQALDTLGGLDALAAAVGWKEKHTVKTQALVAIAVGAGADVDDLWRQRGLEAAAKDTWAAQDEDRMNAMRAFAALLVSYTNGDRQSMTHQGLFDFIEHQK